MQATAFIVLVAVGADYNLLLITRIREESGSGIRSGIIRAVRSTGGVITSAGIIFAASMFGLLFGSLSTMVQTGFIIGMGLLIDTFVVRTDHRAGPGGADRPGELVALQAKLAPPVTPRTRIDGTNT